DASSSSPVSRMPTSPSEGVSTPPYVGAPQRVQHEVLAGDSVMAYKLNRRAFLIFSGGSVLAAACGGGGSSDSSSSSSSSSSPSTSSGPANSPLRLAYFPN